jgi:hypothetical protein
MKFKPSGCSVIAIIVIIVICIVCYLNGQRILAFITGQYKHGYSNIVKTQDKNMSAIKKNYEKNIEGKETKAKSDE